MTAFTFIGDPNDPTDATPSASFRGIEFPRGRPVEVKDEAIAAKLRGNKHFREGGKPLQTPPSSDAPSQPSAPAADEDLLKALINAEEERDAARAYSAQLADEKKAVLAENARLNDENEELRGQLGSPIQQDGTLKGALLALADAKGFKLDRRLKDETLFSQLKQLLDGEDAEPA